MKILILIFTIFLSNLCFAKTIEFENYKVVNLGYISISKNMEIQAGKYKKISEAYQKEIGKRFGYEISSDRTVFQQKGLNDFEKSGFSSYARVIVETDISNYGDYEKLTTHYTATQNELKLLDRELKKEMQSIFSGTGLKLISWQGISITKINGRTALKVSYIRQLNNNPYVWVDMYQFQNNDRLHRLTLSYRLSDEKIWKPLFSQVSKSFIITNVR